MRNSHRTPTKRDDHGVVALEFVFVFPFLLILIFSIAQFGIYFSNKVDVTSAARDAARTFALLGTPVYPAGMSQDPSKPLPVPCVAGDTTSNVSVSLISYYTFDIPLIPLGQKSITATGTMRCGG